jgi:hypothetical protein
MKETAGRGNLLTPERVAERKISDIRRAKIEFQAPETRRLEKR